MGTETKKEPLLSFILPVYRVEQYLPHCLDSILPQMDERCEMILVDDGSPDGSGRICDDYAARDPRIRVLHKENGGPAIARNTGVQMAEGEYICFVDSDDYIREDTVAQLLDWINTVHKDLCFLQSAKVYPDGTEEPVQENIQSRYIRGRSREEVLRYLACCPTFPGGPWGKIIRRKMLNDHAIAFPEGKISEDLIYCLECYLNADGIDCLDFPFYCYRQGRGESLTSNVTPKYYFDTFLFVEEVAERFGKTGKPENADGELALSAAAFEYAILVWQMRQLQNEYTDRAMEKLRQYRWILRFGKSYKAKLTRGAVGLLGIRGAGRLMEFYQKVRR